MLKSRRFHTTEFLLGRVLSLEAAREGGQGLKSLIGQQKMYARVYMEQERGKGAELVGWQKAHTSSKPQRIQPTNT